jgi:biopolymer transport protein ExbD
MGVAMASRKLGAAPDLAPTPSSGGVTGINVTPLVDVLLVLIVVGMVSFGMSRRSLPVALPAPVSQPVPSNPILLELVNDGGFRLNGQVIPGDRLPQLLANVFRSRPVKILFIKTGPNRSHQEFITAADLARAAGVVTVAVVGG